MTHRVSRLLATLLVGGTLFTGVSAASAADRPAPLGAPHTVSASSYVLVLKSNAWLRYWPSTDSPVIRTVHAGRGFRVLEEQGDWCRGYSAEDPFSVGWIPCYHLYY